MLHRISGLVLLMLMIVGIGACSSTRIDRQNPLLRKAPASQLAQVYFIRPRTERSMGVADNRLSVEADRHHLLDIAKGEYVLLSMLPGNVWITVNSQTAWGPQAKIKKMTRSRQFRLVSGRTYFIVFSMVDGEFRGVYFKPQSVDLTTAKDLTRFMRAVGAARRLPITALEG